MYIHTGKAQKNKNQSVANEVSQKQSIKGPTFQFVDDRPVALSKTGQKDKIVSNLEKWLIYSLHLLFDVLWTREKSAFLLPIPPRTGHEKRVNFFNTLQKSTLGGGFGILKKSFDWKSKTNARQVTRQASAAH